MSQFLRPNGDVSETGGWVPEPSDTTLWDVIDEASANDADYAWVDGAGGGDNFLVTLSSPGATPGSGTHAYRYRFKRIGGAKTTTIRANLTEGEFPRWAGAITEVTDNWQEVTDTLNQAAIDAITDFGNLELSFVIGVSGGGRASDPVVSWAEFEVPDGATGGYYHGLKVQGVGELALCDVGNHPLRIRKGGTTYGIELVDTTDSNASKARIKTPSGIKAIRKYT